MANTARNLVIGTRGSALARWQSEWVRAELGRAWPDVVCRLQPITTSGDRLLDMPLPEIGGKGVFTEELESALRSNQIDLAVHSLKDLPIQSPDDLTLGAICRRADARDVLISSAGRSFGELPAGARLGTSSPRRAAQLLAARPDLTLRPLRGNVDSRVRKALSGEYDAIVLAAAGVLRLGLTEHIREYLSFELMLPAPGQGALAVQCRAADTSVLNLLRPLDHQATRAAVTAERAFLDALGGGCSAPIAAYATAEGDTRLSLTGLVAAVRGARVIRVAGSGADPLAVGAQLAQQALAQGAAELLI